MHRWPPPRVYFPYGPFLAICTPLTAHPAPLSLPCVRILPFSLSRAGGRGPRVKTNPGWVRGGGVGIFTRSISIPKGGLTLCLLDRKLEVFSAYLLIVIVADVGAAITHLPTCGRDS